MNQEEYLEKAHEVLLKLLLEFDRVCKKYDVQYYLICGSLLGAVRHQDFIPWDDDVDVAMTRADFDKVKKHFKEERSEGDFVFVDYNELGKGVFLDFMTRLVYMGEELPVNVFRKIRGKGRTDIDNHMPIDIYILDNAPDDEKKHKRLTMFIQGLYGLAMGHRAYVNYDEYKTEEEKRQKLIKRVSTIGKYIPLGLIFWMYERARRWYSKKEGKDYFESNGWIYCIPWRFPKEWFAEGTTLPVHGHMIQAPKNYEEFLKMHYWDYMSLPPEDKRKPSHSEWASGVFQE